ncbi:MAG: carbohydrate kinase family protein [Cellulomonadaceae bacterium]|nr:carbohydrate kinase family protein [Cellulomonadaceae bacterium]
MIRALVVGGIGVDINVSLYDGQWPLPNADTIFVPQIANLSLGHAGSGVALQAAALGCKVFAADIIGDDSFGQFANKELADRGVDLVAAIDPAGTRRSVNLVRSDGGRLSLHDPRHDYELMPDSTLWRNLLNNVDWAHIVIVNWARLALRDARAQGVLTSTDVQDWDGIDEHHKEFAYNADVVFCSAANISSPDDMAANIFAHGIARLVIITQGSKGALIYERDPSGAAPQSAPLTPIHVPAITLPDYQIIDTNGAGDSFTATFMTEWLSGHSPAKAGRRAAIAASYSASHRGTNYHLVTATDLTRFAQN